MSEDKLDHIMQTTSVMMKFYRELDSKFHHREKELTEFSDMFRNVSESIADYFDELREKGIPPEESYITKWLNDGDYSEHFNSIMSFLEANFEHYFEKN